MRNLFMHRFFMAAITVAVIASPLRAEDTKLNVGKVNNVLATLLEEVLKDNDGQLGSFFTEATFEVDEAGTDLSSNDSIKAKISSSATAAGAVWAPNTNTTLQLDLAMTADRLKQSASLSLRAELQSDTLAMFRFAAGKLTEEGCHNTGTDKAVCETLKAIASAQDITSVFASLTKLSQIYTIDAYQRVKAAIKDLDAAKGEDKVWMERRLKNAKETLDLAILLQASMSIAYEKGKQTETFVLKLTDLSLFTNTRVPELEVHMDKARLDVTVRLIQTDIKDIDGYFARKASIEKDLIKLQNQDPKLVKSAKETIQFFLGITKEIIGKPRS